MSRGFFHVDPALSLASGEFFEEFMNLINRKTVRSDEMISREDDIELPSVRCALFHVKEGNVNRKKEAVLVLEYLGLIGRRDKLLDDEWVDVEILVKICDILRPWPIEIDPGKSPVFQNMHWCFFFLIIAVENRIDKSLLSGVSSHYVQTSFAWFDSLVPENTFLESWTPGIHRIREILSFLSDLLRVHLPSD